jgi:hypothetical protein
MIYDNLPIFAQPPTCKALIVIGREELSPVIDILINSYNFGVKGIFSPAENVPCYKK